MQKEFLGLRTIIYRVSDLTKAKAWYSEVFHTTPYFDEPFYVGFEIAGYELGLQPDTTEGKKTANIETYWGVNDIEASYQRMIALGALGVSAPTNVGGDIIVATLNDPWGNILGLIYNPTFSLEGK